MNSEVLVLCRRLIATPSVTTEGTRRIAELCAKELLAPGGIEVRLIPSPREGDAQVNLLAIVRGRDSRAAPLVLNTHLDTVPAGDPGLWTECGGDPFNPVIAGDRIYGLGSADTKLDFVAKAIALAECRAPRRGVYLVGAFGEEHGLVGAKEIAGTAMVPRGALAFVGEPSHLAVVTAHKGLMAFELRLKSEAARRHRPLHGRGEGTTKVLFTGRAAHSSTPALGRNAIVDALDFVAGRRGLQVIGIEGGDAVNKVPARCELRIAGPAPDLPDDAAQVADLPEAGGDPLAPGLLLAAAKFAQALKNFADRSGADADFAAPAMTSNVGVIRSTDGGLRLEFEVRPPPGVSIESARQDVRSISSIISRRLRGIEAEPIELRANPGFRTAQASETVEIAMTALARAQIELKTAVKAGCTEAGVYAQAGLAPVVFGPGPSAGVIHAPNEYNLLSEVEAAIRFYRALLEM